MDSSDDAGDAGSEARRMDALRRYDILDTPPDGAFDRVTAMAARRFGAPISVVSLVDVDRIWFKSRHGIDIDEIGRDPGLCASAILKAAPHILPDARLDPQALANPLVAGSFGLRFYAGVPLTTHDGFNLGMLCVIDRDPHPVEQAQIDDLEDLASVIMDQMELRLSARRAVAQAELMAREIDHRVMNSLQFVASLLSMQARSVDDGDGDGDVARQLEMAAGRVGAVARVHRHLYAAEGGKVSCTAFLRRFCAELSGILARSIAVEGGEIDVPAASLKPIGLIVNELLTNAAKHAEGRIGVTLRIADGLLELCVSDEGKGLPAGFDPSACAGLGMKVVVALVRRLEGRLDFGPNPGGGGTCFTIVFAAEGRTAA